MNSMNIKETQSHNIFNIVVETRDKANKQNVISSSLKFVDLAGSLKKDNKETNASIAALKRVVNALANPKNPIDSKVKAIPFKDSKLSMILNQSLGGNSITLMIACMCPADQMVD